MARKAFLLRVDPQVLAEIQRWADEDLRSLNGQIEFLLRESLARRGRKSDGNNQKDAPPGEADESETE